MNAYLIPGMTGLLAGLLLHWAGFDRAESLRAALGLRRSLALRTGLTALGWGMLLTSLLMWLAVIDVDTVTVLPLSLGTLLGGALLGVLLGVAGFTPTTAFAGLGSGAGLECLALLAGCWLGTALLPHLESLLAPLRTAPPYAAATLFAVTLDEPFLFGGGFLGMICLGALLIVWGMCVPSPKGPIVPEEAPTPQSASADSSPAEGSLEESPEPESAPEETVVLTLEGEEPLVVDTGMDEAEAEPTPATAVGEELAPPGPAQSTDEDGDSHRDLE